MEGAGVVGLGEIVLAVFVLPLVVCCALRGAIGPLGPLVVAHSDEFFFFFRFDVMQILQYMTD